jgi:MFS family permease
MKRSIRRDYNYIGANSQILRLSIRDMSANRWVLLAGGIAYFLMSFQALVVDKQFVVIFLLLSLVFITESFVRSDDRHKVEPLFCSLPVKRSSMVLARYFSVLAIVIMLSAITYLSVLVAQAVIPAYVFQIGQWENFTLLFFGIYLFSIFISVSFHNHFRFGYKGYPINLVINSIIALVAGTVPWIGLYVIASLYGGSWALAPYTGQAQGSGAFVLGVTAKTISVLGKSFFYSTLSIAMTLFIAGSIKLSINSYKNRDF